eukprot:CAMPEP_0182470040 /NCGR_PEP_ID=MMETSP1319-20130603/18050_1 /TAXON_ID=172717 /ORGANISM="Bolidomonas pacifica, Strain RCC208" /LENGTH=94 /DNA_ID=CAMNT_0024670431 /DNA_START=41 /DNA_END=325 /DNA_ORIENTATION=-
MALVLLHPRVNGPKPHVVVHVEAEERAGLAPRLDRYQVVEGDVPREYYVLLHVHEVLSRPRRHLPELRAQVVPHCAQEFEDGVALPHHDVLPVA